MNCLDNPNNTKVLAIDDGDVLMSLTFVNGENLLSVRISLCYYFIIKQ